MEYSKVNNVGCFRAAFQNGMSFEVFDLQDFVVF